ncbi:MAG TPA: flagellar hook protein [Persephonella sp.]|uniref:Flagellar hook-associated protein 3 n=1 Tax=Persephonella marina (strain DSM 14350 / EX-H1) TaxID=123214 RepID=C0QRT5_PERMH|nr:MULTISPECIES: flagellar hook protein [Persephonella]ACO04287.1 flagellar hook-associated protein 3 [Persephonella marina EX-H1]HCB69126.1 flagellar hook protein [Persephonella sp.]
MRIPDISFFDTFIKYDRIREKDIERYTKELASGKKLLSPSDNTIDTVRSLRFKRLNNDIETYNRNIDLVKGTLDVAESTLGNIVNAGQEVRVEIIRLMNTGVLDYEDAQILRDYLSSLRDYIINQANVSIGDSRIFGGVKSQIDPFDPVTGVYQGETVETTVPVAKGVELNTTFNGQSYLGVNTNTGKMAMVDAIDEIISIIDGASASPPTRSLEEINTATINVTVDGKNYGNVTILEAFDIGLDKVMQQRSKIGEQMVIADNLKVQNDTMRVNFSELISKLEDADYAGVISELEKSKTAYEALLASIAQNKDLSLLKFIK